MRGLRAAATAAAVAIVVLGGGARAHARRGVRPLFEPTDLDLDDPGQIEFDLQFGAVRSQGPWRIVVPDFEINVGVNNTLEIDLDGAYAIEGPTNGPFAFDHSAPDSLWLSAKLGLWDWTDDDKNAQSSTWAIGLQFGPKMRPAAPSLRGFGIELLALIGHNVGRLHVVLNAGGFVDPAQDASSDPPVGLELGFDVDRDLDATDTFSFIGELSGVHFVSPDPDQLVITAGISYKPRPWIELSAIGLVGFFAGSDRYGFLLGASPSFHLWH